MIPAAFDYARPTNLEEALNLLGGAGAMPLAGGQSLIPLLSTRDAEPALLVDISRLAELRHIDVQNGDLVVGAAATLAAVATSTAAQEIALLAKVLASVASAAIRNRGTLVGNLVGASPNSELPTAVVALDARFVLRTATGHRVVEAERFFVGPHQTVLSNGEIVTEIRFPLRPSGTTIEAFSEVSARAGAPPLCCVAVCLTIEPAGRVSDARIVAVGIVGRPARCQNSEAAIVGHPAVEALERLVGIEEAMSPAPDLPNSGYALDVAPVLIRRAVAEALGKVDPTGSHQEQPA